ncbi:hypothetical protein PLICRDRAFT_375281 [Plicaturopsis crispa FD-325 SS-3]|uniref:Uncharacterized protein n=1 Tax=Plicaturopsis crispa FD-325 SS-3 TaxID=944288 RepID=A0A0C9T7W6_PLICR|nr:hypothetical protein PLICRDRAFT_375281 [Plicaturopsis crispa FD-325 SS-3]
MAEAADTAAGTGICTAVNESTGKTCACQCYTEHDNLATGQPVTCRECCHGRSLHCGSSPSLGGSSAPVTDMLRSLVSPEAYEHARRETNKGFRPSSDNQDTKKGDLKSKAKKPSKGMKDNKGMKDDGAQKVEGGVKLAGIILFPAGLDENGDLRRTRAPDMGDIDRLEAGGLAITNTSGPIVFGRAWDRQRMDSFLREKLPDGFATLDTFNEVADKPPYVLLFKQGRHLRVVKKVVDGSSANFYKHRSSSAEYFLYLGTVREFTVEDTPGGRCLARPVLSDSSESPGSSGEESGGSTNDTPSTSTKHRTQKGDRRSKRGSHGRPRESVRDRLRHNAKLMKQKKTTKRPRSPLFDLTDDEHPQQSVRD